VSEDRWEERETEPPTLRQARELKLAQLCVVIEKALPQKYTKVSGLVYFLRQVTRKSTFENVIPPLPHRSRCLPPSDCPLMYLCRVCVCVYVCVVCACTHPHSLVYISTQSGVRTHTHGHKYTHHFDVCMCIQLQPSKSTGAPGKTKEHK